MAIKPPSHLSGATKRGWRELQSEYDITDGAGQLLLNVVWENWDQAQTARRLWPVRGYVIEERQHRE